MAKLPESWRTLSNEIRKLREEVRQLRNRSPFANSGLEVTDEDQLTQSGSITIPDNGLLLVDGGDVVMLDQEPSATTLFRLGVQEFLDRGITISRNDGSPALEVRKALSGASQSLSLYDKAGARIGGDAILANSGFDAPHIPMQFIPVDYTSAATAQTTSSTTFVATHEHRGFRQNPAFLPQFMVKCSDGTTSAQIQIWDVVNSVYLNGFLGSPSPVTTTVPTGTTTFTLFTAPAKMQVPGGMSEAIYLQIHVKRTAGAGSVTVAPVRTIGYGF